MSLPKNLTPSDFLNLQKRFWRKVRRAGPDECWMWFAAVDKDGYGKFKVGTLTKRAPRIAYELKKGPIRGKLIIMHSCDTPRCVNPAHLRTGTLADNHDDMVKKGRKKYFFGDDNGARKHPERLKRGEDHGRAKLTWDIVNHIRLVVSKKEITQVKLAKKYGVSPATICLIVKYKIWTKQ